MLEGRTRKAHMYAMVSVGGGGKTNSCTDNILQQAQPFVSKDTHRLPRYFSNQTQEYVSSRLIPQGQALRVASQALTDQPRLHERIPFGWKNFAGLLHCTDCRALLWKSAIFCSLIVSIYRVSETMRTLVFCCSTLYNPRARSVRGCTMNERFIEQIRTQGICYGIYHGAGGQGVR